uniref:Uncharacterized protein n=1 Tax=Octopus bimaculoides TaxID=37653 RepID=A0A0L8GIY3_OCTBM
MANTLWNQLHVLQILVSNSLEAFHDNHIFFSLPKLLHRDIFTFSLRENFSAVNR